MSWLPVPENFRAKLRDVRSIKDPGKRLAGLADLARYQLSLVETIQVDNVFCQSVTEGKAGFAPVRLAVLSSSTINHLLPAIRVAGLRWGLCIETYAGGFGQYRQEILGASPSLRAFGPDAVLLSLAFRDVVADLPVQISAKDADRAIGDAVSGLRALWSKLSADFGATVVQQSFIDVSEGLFGNYDRCVPGTSASLAIRLNNVLADAIVQDDVLLLDIARASAQGGIDSWFDVGRWFQAKMEIAPGAAPLYGEIVARLISAHRGQARKCLVLDLDNTLWGGVIGDDGLDGIVLGEGSALGEAHLSLQRYAKSLADRGVILAVCSKNDADLAEAAFRDHPEMLLQRSDVAVFVANWHDKTENLRSIAEQLNIGLNSLVLVDDNPAERARVRQSLPMVAVPELPADVAGYVGCVAAAGYFEAVGFTDEDQQRTENYAANVKREAFCHASQSMDTFLSGLEMSVAYSGIKKSDVNRVAQLLNKTNQFNTTMRRYSTDELSGIASVPENMVLQFRLIDRFGDNGIVGVMVLCENAKEPGILDVANWVMSCRVFGRQLEYETMNIAVETARARRIRALRAAYLPTERNTVISGLYEELGFSRMHEQASPADRSLWNLDLESYVSKKTYIARQECVDD